MADIVLTLFKNADVYMEESTQKMLPVMSHIYVSMN